MPDPSDYQQRFWHEAVELRVHVYYLYEYQLLLQRWNSRITWLLAITSSGSIATWAVWQQLPIVWASLIALSQVVTAIRPHLALDRQNKALAELTRDLSSLAIETERRWYAVSEGMLTTSEIHEETIAVKSKKDAAQYHQLGQAPLPKRPVLLSTAEEAARTYFSSHYGVR